IIKFNAALLSDDSEAALKNYLDLGFNGQELIRHLSAAEKTKNKQMQLILNCLNNLLLVMHRQSSESLHPVAVEICESLVSEQNVDFLLEHCVFKRKLPFSIAVFQLYATIAALKLEFATSILLSCKFNHIVLAQVEGIRPAFVQFVAAFFVHQDPHLEKETFGKTNLINTLFYQIHHHHNDLTSVLTVLDIIGKLLQSSNISKATKCSLISSHLTSLLTLANNLEDHPHFNSEETQLIEDKMKQVLQLLISPVHGIRFQPKKGLPPMVKIRPNFLFLRTFTSNSMKLEHLTEHVREFIIETLFNCWDILRPFLQHLSSFLAPFSNSPHLVIDFLIESEDKEIRKKYKSLMKVYRANFAVVLAWLDLKLQGRLDDSPFPKVSIDPVLLQALRSRLVDSVQARLIFSEKWRSNFAKVSEQNFDLSHLQSQLFDAELPKSEPMEVTDAPQEGKQEEETIPSLEDQAAAISCKRMRKIASKFAHCFRDDDQKFDKYPSLLTKVANNLEDILLQSEPVMLHGLAHLILTSDCQDMLSWDTEEGKLGLSTIAQWFLSRNSAETRKLLGEETGLLRTALIHLLAALTSRHTEQMSLLLGPYLILASYGGSCSFADRCLLYILFKLDSCSYPSVDVLLWSSTTSTLASQLQFQDACLCTLDPKSRLFAAPSLASLDPKMAQNSLLAHPEISFPNSMGIPRLVDSAQYKSILATGMDVYDLFFLLPWFDRYLSCEDQANLETFYRSDALSLCTMGLCSYSKSLRNWSKTVIARYHALASTQLDEGKRYWEKRKKLVEELHSLGGHEEEEDDQEEKEPLAKKPRGKANKTVFQAKHAITSLVKPKTLSFKELPIIVFLLDSLRNSISPGGVEHLDGAWRSSNMLPEHGHDDTHRLTHIHALFFARSLGVISQPNSPMFQYVLDTFMAKPAVKMNRVPDFFRLLFSVHLNFDEARFWILSLIADSLSDSADFLLLEKSKVFKHTLVLFNCSNTSRRCRSQILRILVNATRIKRVSHALVKFHQLLFWLSHCLSNHE
ncbi:hypothetical protein Ciccas_008723, partial [Cichlidogyrus casuarinus]